MISPVKLHFKWAGIKRIPAQDGFRTIPKADLYIDCRAIAEAGVPGWSGKCPEFQEGVLAQSFVALSAIENLITDSLRHIPARRGGKDPYKDAYVVLFMCAYGIHRSVATCHIIAKAMKIKGYDVTIVESTPVEGFKR